MARDSATSSPARSAVTPSNGSIDEIFVAGSQQAGSRMIPAGYSIHLRGWAIDAQMMLPAADARVVIDDTLELAASCGAPREDIAAFYGEPRLVRCGFDAVIPTGLGPGDHQITIHAVGQDGRAFIAATADVYVIASLYPQRFTASPVGGRVGKIIFAVTEGDIRTDAQRAGRTELVVGAAVDVAGWGFDSTRHERFVEAGAVIDGCWYFPSGPRPPESDERAHQVPGIGNCGLRTRFILNFVEPGDHELCLVGRRRDDTWVTIGEPATFEAVEAPLPWIWALPALVQLTRSRIDHVAVYTRDDDYSATPIVPPFDAQRGLSLEQGHGIFLRGWAVDVPARAPASAVYVSLDGDRHNPVPARYGRATPTPPGIFGPARWTNCGFTALIPTDDLKPGRHTLEPLIVASSGFGYYRTETALTFEILTERG